MKLVEAAKTGRWKVAGSSLAGECEGVSFMGETRWWGRQWTIVGHSEYVVPEPLILFISEMGMDRGFWRDMEVGGHDFDGNVDQERYAFDRRHFVFCDIPGLLRLLIGPSTIQAFRTARGEPSIVLYVKGGIVETKAEHLAADETAIARHVALHRALREDHARLASSWQTRLANASGRGNTTWPLTGQINSRVGTLLVATTWEMHPESRDGAEWESGYHSLRTEVTAAGDRSKPRWTFAESDPGDRTTHTIGKRRWTLRGQPSVPIDRIVPFIEEADIVSLGFGDKLTISLRGLANARQLAASRSLAETLLHAQITSQSPYR